MERNVLHKNYILMRSGIAFCLLLIALGLFFVIHGYVDNMFFQEKEQLGFGIIGFAVIQMILFILLNQQKKETIIFTSTGITVNYSWYTQFR